MFDSFKSDAPNSGEELSTSAAMEQLEALTQVRVECAACEEQLSRVCCVCGAVEESVLCV